MFGRFDKGRKITEEKILVSKRPEDLNDVYLRFIRRVREKLLLAPCCLPPVRLPVRAETTRFPAERLFFMLYVERFYYSYFEKNLKIGALFFF
jgi:hypothetical protein